MYSPKLKPELVRKLYRHKQSQQKKRPMTYYVNEAVEQYLSHQDEKQKLIPDDKRGVLGK